MSITEVTIHTPTDRRYAIQALRDLALSIEDRIRECRSEGAMREWGRCVAGNLNLWIGEMELIISRAGE